MTSSSTSFCNSVKALTEHFFYLSFWKNKAYFQDYFFTVLNILAATSLLLEIETVMILVKLNSDYCESIQKTTAPMKMYQ